MEMSHFNHDLKHAFDFSLIGGKLNKDILFFCDSL